MVHEVDICPILSFEQERMFFLDQMHPGNPAHYIRGALRLNGPVRIDRLEQSLDYVAQRHDLLRTTFTLTNDRPSQVIAASLKVDLTRIDLSETPLAQRHGEAQQRATQLVQQPFDLTQGPLWRAGLLQLGDHDHLLVLSLHPIIADGDMSLGLLFQELFTCYDAGSVAQLQPKPAWQYQDYARWQRQTLTDEALDAHRAYWQRQLGDGGSSQAPAPILQLPADRPRPAVQTYAGACQYLRLSQSLSASLMQVSRQASVSRFTMLLAAFKVWLSHVTQQGDIIVGSHSAGRHHPHSRDLIGYFGTPLVLRTDLSDNPTFEALLSRVSEVVSQAEAHQDYPFQKLVEALNLTRDMSYTPLFQVFFVERDMMTPVVTDPNLTLSPWDIETTAVAYDLTVSVQETDQGLLWAWEYNTDLFDYSTIARLLGHFETLLGNIAADPSGRIGQFSLLTDAQRQQVLVAWNETHTAYPQQCVHQWVEAQASQTPDLIAVIHDDRKLTYRDLNRQANQLAHYLRTTGVGPDQLVGLCLPRSPELIVGLLGILKAGGAYVPIDPAYPSERIQYMLADAQVRVVLTTATLAQALAPLAQAIEARTCVHLDTDWSQIAAQSEANPPGSVAPHHLAYCLYTSGSTGQPKGVAMEHLALSNLIAWHLRHRRSEVGTKMLQFSPMRFDVSFHETFATLGSGGALVLISEETRRNPFALLDVMQAQGVEKVYLPFIALQQLAEAAEMEPAPSALREVITAGEQLQITPAIANLFRRTGATLHHHYGGTECQDVTAFTLSGDVDHWPALPAIGRPINNARIYILDRFYQPVPMGVPGELYVGGAVLARDYLHRPELTAERFIANPFGPGRLYHTGDLARYRPDGQIEHLGRADQQVKIRGFRIELGEIETVLSQHPAVVEGAVVPRDNGVGQHDLVAYVVPHQPADHLETEIDQFLRQRLPEYMVPAHILTLDRIPLTPSGKVDRRALPVPDLSQPAWETTLVKPATEIEQVIAGIWQHVLGLTQVSTQANFFDLGGNSLQLMQVHKQLIRHFGSQLRTVTLFQYPTIETLAQHLSESSQADSQPVTSVRRGSREGRQDIAIIGMACRFPGAEDVETFWRNLRDGVESITFFADDELELPDRTVLQQPHFVKAGASLPNIDRFDASFFGYSPREAETMDPQHRFFLECAWEALERAGYNPETYPGSIGIFAGSGPATYLINNILPAQGVSSHAPFHEAAALQRNMGNEPDALAMRVSYKFNLRGPSLSIATTCSTSLVAVHLACQSIRSGECQMALASGVTISVPQNTGYVHQDDMIWSPDGHCRAFDAQAQGTLFGNGSGIVVFKLLDEAIADGDPICAVIKGSAVNNDGALKVGYSAPSVAGQIAVVSEALAAAEVDPRTISYVEAHGTGTALGDPIEVAALTQAFRQHTAQNGFCALGSVKTNFGHLDTAAGIAGLIKTVLALQHKQIPPSLHFEHPNPDIDFAHSPFYVNTRLADWTTPHTPRRAGVSSFGMGGTNGHVVLEEAPPTAGSAPALERGQHLLTLSAQTPEALQDLARRYVDHRAINPDVSLGDMCFTANTGRKPFNYRLAVVTASVEQLRHQLLTASQTPSADVAKRIWVGNAQSPPRGIAFLFTGQGSQYVGMGRELYATQPTFRQTLEHCDEILRPYLGRALLDILYPNPGRAEDDAAHLDQTAYTQPALFALEYALATLWQSWGIEPDVVMGHSVGEYVAACVAGVFSLEDGLALIAERGRLMQALPPGGAMVAMMADETQVRIAIEPYAQTVSIAAINSPQGMVISGWGEHVEAVCAHLKSAGIKPHPLQVSHAFHSPLMEPMLAEFEQAAQQIRFASPTLKLISNVTGKLATAEITTPAYWRRHLRQPVRFSDGMHTLSQLGIDTFIEIGPKPTLLGLGRRCLPDHEGQWLPSLRQGQGEWVQMLSSLASLYVQGQAADWAGFDRDYARRRLSLPTYPFQRQRYWIEAPTQIVLPQPHGADAYLHPLLGRAVYTAGTSEIRFQAHIRPNIPAWLQDHRIQQTTMLPGTAYFEIALAAGAAIADTDQLYLEDVVLQQALIFPDDGAETILQVVLTPEAATTYAFRIFSFTPSATPSRPRLQLPGEQDWRLQASGRIGIGSRDTVEPLDLAGLQAQCDMDIPVEALYQRFQDQAIDYGPSFKAVEQVRYTEGMSLGRLKLADGLGLKPADYHLHPILLDACIQLLDVTFPNSATSALAETWLPFALDTLHLYQTPPDRPLWCHTVRGSEQSWNLYLCDETGQVFADLIGFKMRQVSADAFSQRHFSEWLYELSWQPQPVTTQPLCDTAGPWLVFAENDFGEALMNQLTKLGQPGMLIAPGDTYTRLGQDRITLNPAEPKDFHRLVAEHQPVHQTQDRGVIYLWGAEASREPAAVPETAHTLSVGALHLIQALSAANQPTRLWLVTRGSQAITAREPVAPAQAPLWGLGRTIDLEHPDLNCVCVDLDPTATPAEAVMQLLPVLGSPEPEEQVAIRHGEHYAARLKRHVANHNADPLPDGPFEIRLSDYGSPDQLHFLPLRRRPPGSGEVEIEMRAAALNFRDVLNVLGMLQDDADPPTIHSAAEARLGFECAGHIAAVGPGVTDFAVGDAVMADTEGSWASYVTLDARRVTRKPMHLTMQEAAAVPAAFSAAYYGLHTLANMQPGERVLIHAAAGGVGQAAVQLAQARDAEIFATASPEKWAFLKAQGIEYVMNSRTLDFADTVMRRTHGDGVDIVLNSLSGDFLDKSLSVLAKNGRFIELGKLGIRTAEEVEALRPDAVYEAFDLGELAADDAILVPTLLAELGQQFDTGRLHAPPVTVFPASDVIAAMRHRQQAKHIGKIVLDFSPRTTSTLRPHASYLITGGLGGLGLKVAQDLAARGARHLVLAGRGGATSPEAQDTLRDLQASCSTVTVVQGDVAQRGDVQAMLTACQAQAPLRGVIHAAGVLDDGILQGQTPERFARVMAPKVQGAWHLHTLTQDMPLDFFVCFSSDAALLGYAGQGNYAAANAFMDALAHDRQAMGLPGQGINWGPWAEVGMSAALSSQHQSRFKDQGITFMPVKLGLQAFTAALEQPLPQIGILPVDWTQWLQQRHLQQASPFLEHIRSLANGRTSSDRLNGQATQPVDTKSFQQTLEAAPVAERRNLLMEIGRAHV